MRNFKPIESVQDKRNENQAAALIERTCRCAVKKCEPFESIDWHVFKDGKHVAVAEYKRRYLPSTRFPTVRMSVRKYRALMDGWYRYKVAPLFFWQFDDLFAYVDARDVDASCPFLAGRTDRGATNDLEPMIDVPISSLHTINETTFEDSDGSHGTRLQQAAIMDADVHRTALDTDAP